MVTVPYWRLSGFYWFYFATLGAILPYWTLYLQSRGFNAQTIGQIMAIIMAFKILAPNLWGWVADYTGQRIVLIRFSSLLAALCFSGVLFVEGFWGMILVMSAFSFFWNAALPQVEATTFAYLGRRSHRYTQIRVWGSVGFIIVSVSLGWFFAKHPVTWLPVVLIGLFICVWLTTLFIPHQKTPSIRITHESLRQVLRQPAVTALFVVCLFMQASHGVYYTFYTIYLEGHGYSRGIIGQLWAFGVIAEVLAFLVMHRLLKRFSLHNLLITSLGLASLRWLLIGYYPGLLTVLLFAQTLHAASFGLFHAVAIQFIFQYFPGQLQGRGQALYSSFSFGAGSAIGSLSSGYLWDTIGAQESYLLAALTCGIAAWISWQWVKPNRV